MTTYTVGSGHSLSGVTLDAGDSATVLNGGTAVDITVNQGGTLLDFAGLDDDTLVTFSGDEIIDPAAGASGTVLREGVQTVEGLAVSTVISSGSILAVQGGVAVSANVSNGGTLAVTLDGSTRDTAVSSGGEEVVFPTGAASGTEVFASATQLLLSSSFASGTVLDGGDEVVSTASASATTVLSGGIQGLVLGAVTHGTVVSASGSQEVGSRSIANGTTVVGVAAIQLVVGGGTAIDTVVSGGGLQALGAGGAASATTVASDGGQSVSAGGSANDTVIEGGGIEFIATGGTVTGLTLAEGAAIDLLNFPFVTGAFAKLEAGNVLLVSAGGSSTTIQLASAPGSTVFVVSGDVSGGSLVTGIVPCFCAGTPILTTQGERAVEALSVGDRLPTRSGRLAPLSWIGRRRIDYPSPALCPIRIRAHAFGPGRPHTDLLVSLDHAVWIGEALVPARYLINGASIAGERAAANVDYFHVELPRHNVVYAAGLPAESYLETGNRSAFTDGRGQSALHQGSFRSPVCP